MLRVALIGELSGVHKNLKSGLNSHGCDTILVSNGDGWKRIDGDLQFSLKNRSVVSVVKFILQLLIIFLRVRNYDVVQFAQPQVFPVKFGINRFLMRSLIRNNKRTFLLIGGCNDFITAKYFKSHENYRQLYQALLGGKLILDCEAAKNKNFTKFLLDQVDGCIPLLHEYTLGLKDVNYPKLMPAIQLPLDIDAVKIKPNSLGEKLRIFHGHNRPDVKGTKYISEAFDVISKKHANHVQCILGEKMSLDAYLSELSTVDIVVDQVFSSSTSMNSVYAMALGKIVLGGGEDAYLDEFQIDKCECPLITIKPDVQSIVTAIEKVISKKSSLEQMSRSSREFVSKHHDARSIAAQYIKSWSSI